MSPELNQLPPNQIKGIYDKLAGIQVEYKKRLDTLLEQPDDFDNECEYQKHNIKVSIYDDICERLEELSEEFFRGM